MIVIRRNGQFELVTQPDHAQLARQILALWRHPFLLQHPRREGLLTAVREHDNGWREADAAPRVDRETGEPLDFRRMPRSDRFEIWHRGVERVRDAPYVAALVAHHALEIHGERRHPDWTAFRERTAAARDELLAEAGVESEELAIDYAWLELADLLSLTACGAITGERRLSGYAVRPAGESLEIEPFPLAGATTFQIAGRRIPERTYSSDLEVAMRTAEARWERRRVRLTPPA